MKKLKFWIKQQLANTIFARNYLQSTTKTEERDVFIVGYPKSGNTWMQHMVTGILTGGDMTLVPDTLVQSVVPDIHAKQLYKRFYPINFFKSHHLPQPSYQKVVYLVRDGRDVLASYYAMNLALGLNYSLQEMLDERKGMHYGHWQEHIEQWLSNPYDAEVMIIRYEDLKNDAFPVLKQFCVFAGIERSDDVIQTAIDGCKLVKMQKKETDMGWDNKNWDTKHRFVRRGQVGSYKDELPKNILEQFEKMSKKGLEHFGYIK